MTSAPLVPAAGGEPLSPLARRYAAARPSRFALALERARADAAAGRGAPLLDLTSGSPPASWLPGLDARLDRALARHAAAALRRPYAPDPLGLPRLREAIAAWYRAAGCHDVTAGRIAIAPGTSTAYDWLFRVLVDPARGRVVGPTPTYPLLDELAALAGVATASFPLAPGDADAPWRYDAGRLERHLRGDERLLALVSPHNPTGAEIDAATWNAIAAVARRHALAVVCDEVFSSFRRADAPPARAAPDAFPLSFLLHGTSKLLGLPALKVGWIVARGADERAVADAMHALAHVADAYLSVPDVTQEIAADLMEGIVEEPGGAAPMAHAAWGARAALAEGLGDLGGAGVVFRAPAGLYVIARLTARGVDEEATALAVLEEGIVVHPGFFYGLAGDHLVMTCCAAGGEAAALREAGRRIAQAVERGVAALAQGAGQPPRDPEP